MIRGASVVHYVPGRVRVRVPHARRDPVLLKQIQEFLRGLQGVKKVEINARTGSVVVHYAPESEEDLQSLLSAGESQVWLKPPVLTEADEIAEIVEAEAEFLAAHSQTAFAIVSFVKQLNRAIRQATGNAVDLKVLVPGALAVWAFLKSRSEVSTPLWVTLTIFSINSFVTLHTSTTVHVTPHRIAQ